MWWLHLQQTINNSILMLMFTLHSYTRCPKKNKTKVLKVAEDQRKRIRKFVWQNKLIDNPSQFMIQVDKRFKSIDNPNWFMIQIDWRTKSIDDPSWSTIQVQVRYCSDGLTTLSTYWYSRTPFTKHRYVHRHKPHTEHFYCCHKTYAALINKGIS